MALAKWKASDQVGFSKKHDAPQFAQRSSAFKPSWFGIRRRRFLFVFVALLVLYLFVKNIPTDVAPVGQRYSPIYGSMAPGQIQAHLESQLDQPTSKAQPHEQEYDGSVRFENLAMSLRAHMSWVSTNNVLFASPDLISTSNLVPVACQMARNNRSSVHIALMGRQNVKIEHIVSINGMSPAECPVFWHDARPDHFTESSEKRIQASIRAGFGHCYNTLRPLVVLTSEAAANEDTAADEIFQEIVSGAGTSLITLPIDAQQTMPWITAMDSSSLRALQDVEIEIVIQAYSESAGPLIRLLRSIEAANYHGLFFPKLTIELPAKIDRFASSFLETFRWPPHSSASSSRLTLRHRVDAAPPAAATASLRTIESFYPHAPSTSHVLLLSADAELSSSYLHYIMATLLEYKYGQVNQDLSASLFGISLELPERKANGRTPFVDRTALKKGPFILSQTPNNNAALVMGEQWIDLHSFLAKRLVNDPELARQSESTTDMRGEQPEWLAEAVDLMQARGTYMLYPAFAMNHDMKLVTLHEELHQPPEEYARLDNGPKQSRAFDMSNMLKNDVLTDDVEVSANNDNVTPMAMTQPLQMLLSPDRKGYQKPLPMLSEVPMFTFEGKPIDWIDSRHASKKFADAFSLKQGGCASLEAREKAKEGLVDYLFCEVG